MRVCEGNLWFLACAVLAIACAKRHATGFATSVLATVVLLTLTEAGSVDPPIEPTVPPSDEPTSDGPVVAGMAATAVRTEEETARPPARRSGMNRSAEGNARLKERLLSEMEATTWRQ